VRALLLRTLRTNPRLEGTLEMLLVLEFLCCAAAGRGGVDWYNLCCWARFRRTPGWRAPWRCSRCSRSPAASPLAVAPPEPELLFLLPGDIAAGSEVVLLGARHWICLCGPVPTSSPASHDRLLMNNSVFIFTLIPRAQGSLSWRLLTVAATLCHVFAGPFAGDEHPKGMPAPSLLFLSCDTEYSNPNSSYFVHSDLI
jgi:hypothetical protein